MPMPIINVQLKTGVVTRAQEVDRPYYAFRRFKCFDVMERGKSRVKRTKNDVRPGTPPRAIEVSENEIARFLS